MTTNLRDRTQEILEVGAANRGDFTPTGVPLRMYSWWAKNTASVVPTRENFCHFWRVVAIWAPLVFIAVVLGEFFMSKKGQWTAGLTYVAGMSYWGLSSSSTALLGALLLFIPYMVTGIVCGLIREVEDKDMWDNKLFLYASRVTFPFYIWMRGVIKLASKWPQEWSEPVGKGLLVTACVAVGAFFLFALVMMGLETGWIFLVYMAAGIVGLCALIGGGVFLADFVSGRRRVADRKQAQYELDVLTGKIIPPEVTPREPGPVYKFLKGLGDMIIFAAQVVRVNKWKICPTVEINKYVDMG